MPTPRQIQQMLITASALQRSGRLAEAESIYRQVLDASPQNTDALYLLGMLLNATRRYAEAVPLFERAIQINPTRAKYHANLAAALGAPGLGRIDEAIALYQKAIALEPTHAALRNNLGNEYRAADRWDLAMQCYQQALELSPEYVDAWSNYGVTLQETAQTPQDFHRAMAAYEKAIALDANFPLAHWNLGVVHLLLGDLERGFAECQWRWKCESFSANVRFATQLEWGTSEGVGHPDIAGRRILIYSEQGLGDSIQFIRYAQILAARGATVLLRCPVELQSLLARASGVSAVFCRIQDVGAYDWHIPTLTLPFALKTRLETIPASVPYLSADPARSQFWRQRVQSTVGPRTKLRIGLAWAGSPANKNDKNRSMRLERLLPLSRVSETAEFLSLQKGPAAAQIAECPALKIFDFGPDLRDFGETAALMDQLDLVITVDTAVGHLAGAMGKPVWLLLPHLPDWRWMLERSDSPWYPTMRLFRQPRRGDWETVVENVVDALKLPSGK
ncbi:MAG TPA: tetratricopeptide repeat protein [Tepidisphaeraceae bacterium]|nr:tetratricopeptide repeat protein [Tepidisphaeraceae bacterium]